MRFIKIQAIRERLKQQSINATLAMSLFLKVKVQNRIASKGGGDPEMREKTEIRST